MTVTIIATTAMGLEAVLGRELKDLGYTDVQLSDGKAEFKGTLADICKSNIWLRTAGRIYIKMGEFFAMTFDDLFDETQAIPWEHWIGPNDRFPISKVTSRKSELFSKSDCQAIVKKAISERLKKAHNVTHLPETGDAYAVRIQLDKDRVTLSIDATGDGLNRRGYRAHMDIAPLRETLAAGLILLSRWRPEDVLIDPLCGTGTLLIEAGLIAKNIAPGLKRSFVSETWKCIPSRLWNAARLDAKDCIKPDVKVRIFGSDTNHTVLSVARKNIELAGLTDIFVQNLDVADLKSRYQVGKIITNPPYGERLGTVLETENLYKQLGKTLHTEFPEWDYYVITPNKDFEDLFKQKATKKRKLFNGPIECCYYQFFQIKKRPKRDSSDIPTEQVN